MIHSRQNSPAEALDQAPRSGASEDVPEGERYIQISDTAAKVLANQIRERVTFLLEANNTELARRRGFEAEANQAYCELRLLRAECQRLRELNGILSGFIEKSHANSGEDVPGEISAAMDAVFPADVFAICMRVQPSAQSARPSPMNAAIEALRSLQGCLADVVYVHGAYGECWSNTEPSQDVEYEEVDIAGIVARFDQQAESA